MKDSIDFGSMDIPKLFRKLLIPTVLGMIFSAVFVITDGIFVGRGIWLGRYCNDGADVSVWFVGEGEALFSTWGYVGNAPSQITFGPQLYVKLGLNPNDLVITEPLNLDMSIAALIAEMNICTTTWKGMVSAEYQMV